MKDLTKSASEITSEKIKVLGLQELTEVAGGRAADWSTNSNNCGTVASNEWSTYSNGCKGGELIQER